MSSAPAGGVARAALYGRPRSETLEAKGREAADDCLVDFDAAAVAHRQVSPPACANHHEGGWERGKRGGPVTHRILVMCASAAVFAALSASAAHANTRPLGALFVGTDQEEFDGAVNGPDRLGRFRTDGPNVVRGKLLPTPYPINGMGNGRGFLYAGDPYSNTIRKISYNGSLLGTIVGGFSPGCCSEDMVRVGKYIYHAHWPSAI